MASAEADTNANANVNASAQAPLPQPLPPPQPLRKQAVRFQDGDDVEQPLQFGQITLRPAAPGDPPFSRPWHLTKIALGASSIVVAVIILALGIYLSVAGEPSSGYLGLIGPTAGLALVWQMVEFIALWASHQRYGVHPGAHVGLHLLIWLLAVVGIVAVSFGISDYWENDAYYPDNEFYDYPDNYEGQYVSTLEAILAFLCILLCIHFALFVRACVETNERSRLGRTVYYVPVPVPMSNAPGAYGPASGFYGSALPQQQQQRRQSQQQQQVPAEAMRGVPSNGPTVPDQALYGYYAPAGSQQPTGTAVPPRRSRAGPSSSSEASSSRQA